ncbi:MAG: 5-deoxy-glucuronate isomerase [Actinomycetota bacterium]|nr:5-deoxy-glucuronate isomerase [Actinomycetota bacterium]
MSLHRSSGGTVGSGPGELISITPEEAGWQWAGLRVLRLEPGTPTVVRTGSSEVFVLPLSGSLQVSVALAPADGGTGRAEAAFGLSGRTSVFTRVTDFVYAGRDSELTLMSSRGAEVALPSARCERRLPAAYGPADTAQVEIRGAGQSTRQVTNFGVPGIWDHAERLMACEVITPPGNWSSYPPHKHDVTAPSPAANEEIYLYRVAGPDQRTPARAGFGLHHGYTGPEHEVSGLEPFDLVAQVRDLDVVLAPYGYHGPGAASPGYPLYALSVLAGPGPERSMDSCDDPAHAWVRETWPVTAADPRVPFTTVVSSVGSTGAMNLGHLRDHR